MKKIIIILSLCFFSCDPFADPFTDYDSQCIVGGKYTICGLPSDNPFDPQSVATVIITDKANGYVRYRWDYDTASDILFTRSCKEFVRSINYCK